MDIFFSLLSALLIGLNTIVIKKSLARVNPFTAATVMTAVGVVIFWAMVFIFLPDDNYLRYPKAILLFIVAGIFAPALVRWIFFTSVDRVGTSIASSALATTPAFAVVFSVIFLHEKMSPAMAMGLALIVGGIIIFERDIKTKNPKSRTDPKDLALPFLAALVASIAVNFRKMALQELNLPILGAALGFGSALMLYLAVMMVAPKLRRSFRLDVRDIFLLIAGGFSLALGWLCIFYALSFGPVVLVAPLISLHPLVVLVMSIFFLKDVEKTTWQTLSGCASVVIGVVMIAVFR